MSPSILIKSESHTTQEGNNIPPKGSLLSIFLFSSNSDKFCILLTLSLPECLMEFCKVILTFVCGRNPMMWPFKWKLSACTFTWCYLFLRMLENEIWEFGRNLPLATFGIERVNKGPHAQLSQKGINSGRRKWPSKAHVKIIFDQLFHVLLSRYVRGYQNNCLFVKRSTVL